MSDNPEATPEYVPPDKRMRVRAKVYKSLEKTDEGDDFYTVDLGANTCECSNGAAYFWFRAKEMWLVRRPCTHKIRAFSSLIEELDHPEDLVDIYIQYVANRYNIYEVTSAFHKELRRGDFERAYFWGSLRAAHYRSLKSTLQYLLNIVYEETREHNLANWLVDRLAEKDYSRATIAKGIKWFCEAPKKWFLPYRVNIFYAEMRGYNDLCDRFSNHVARAGDIIPYLDNREELVTALRAPITPDHFQFGVKGLQKAADVDIQDLRWYMVSELASIGLADNKPGVQEHLDYITRRREVTKNIGYHDVNMIADCVGHGEPYGAGLLPTAQTTPLLRRPKVPTFAFGRAPAIPLYAHDNHTWAGKAKIRRYPMQLSPEAVQTDLDFRWCGAYFGVAFRTISVAQHGCIADWHEVVWPDWLHRIVQRLWY